MRTMGAPVLDDVRAYLRTPSSTTQAVRTAVVVLVGCHLALRAWQLFGGWFYSDDFIFLGDALRAPFGTELLMTPHDSQLMPVGVAISWVVAQAGGYAWWLAALTTLAMQALAAVLAWFALRALFGERPATLVPLTFYLFAAMTPESLHWWAAALNALPQQAAFFALLLCLTLWTRDRRARHAVGAVLALALAVASGPRGLVMVVPLALVVLLFLTPGPWARRPLTVLRRDWPLAVPLLVLAVGYLVVYRATTPPPVEAAGDAPAGRLLLNLVGTSWLPSLVGGPWRWDEYNPPMSRPDPPLVLHLAAAVVVVGLLVLLLRRSPRTTLAGLTVLVAQLALTWLALVYGRGLQLGAAAGLMTRYLTDTLPVTAVVIGLLTLPVVGAGGQPSPPPWRLRPRLAVVGAATFLLGAVVSTVTYASHWHDPYPARSFVQAAAASITQDPVTVADVEVPPLVQSPLAFPENLPSRLLLPVGDLRTATRGNDLALLDRDGVPRKALVTAYTTSGPGPDRGCGYRVRQGDPVTLRVDRDEVRIFWWLSLGYLASGDGRMEVVVDDREPVVASVRQGLHTWFLQGEEQFATITLRALDPGLTVCVDRADVGEIGELG
jgi:hypothetical protein